MEKTLSNHAASVDGRIEAVTICHARRIGRDTESKLARTCVTSKAIDSLDKTERAIRCGMEAALLL